MSLAVFNSVSTHFSFNPIGRIMSGINIFTPHSYVTDGRRYASVYLDPDISGGIIYKIMASQFNGPSAPPQNGMPPGSGDGSSNSRKKGPIVIDLFAQQRSTNPLILQQAALVRQFDMSGGDSHTSLSDERSGYALDRGLDISSKITGLTQFGRIEENTAQMLAARESRGNFDPLRVLTIGPGYGIMEAELKELFKEKIAIDTFSLTSLLNEAAHAAVRTEYLGDYNFHNLPQDYDLIISIFGTRALNPKRMVEQIANALAKGGEAVFTLTPWDAQDDQRNFSLGVREREYLRTQGLSSAAVTGIDLNTAIYLKNNNWLTQLTIPRWQDLPFRFHVQLEKDGTYYGPYDDIKTAAIRKMAERELSQILKARGFDVQHARRHYRNGNVFSDIVRVAVRDAIEDGLPLNIILREQIKLHENSAGYKNLFIPQQSSRVSLASAWLRAWWSGR